FIRTSTWQRYESTIAGAARSSRNTDGAPRALNTERPAQRWPFLFGCTAGPHAPAAVADYLSFAADVVFRRQPYAMTSRYMRKQPQIDYAHSCVGNPEGRKKEREENFADDDRSDRAWDRPCGRRRPCRTALHQGAADGGCDQQLGRVLHRRDGRLRPGKLRRPGHA